MAHKNFPYVLITHENGKVMAWSEENQQLCYCTVLKSDFEDFPARFYTVNKANKLINKTRKTREKLGRGQETFKLIPFIKIKG